MVKEVTDSNFHDRVLKSKLPVVVDFWAPWCGPCHMVSPIVEKLSTEYADRFEFCKINVDQSPETARRYGIMSIPTLMVFNGGEYVNHIVGAVPEQKLKSFIDTVL